MDRIDEFRKQVQKLLTEYADIHKNSIDIETQVIFDEQRDHYQLVTVGWQGNDRVYGPLMHIDIKGGKIWVQHNRTEMLVAEELVERGVPKEAIVLGFQPAFMRQFTEFSVN
ncbi:MAG: XisI protein [Caldilineaceae bacterium]